MAPQNWPQPSRVGLHLLALSGVAVAIPLLSVLADNSTFLVVHGATPARIIATTVAIILVPAALLVLPYWAATRAGLTRAHLLAIAAIWIISVLLGIQIATSVLPGPAWLLVSAGVLLGSALTWTYPRFRPLQQFLDYLAAAPVVVAGIFLLTPPVGDLVRPGTIAQAAASPAHEASPVVVVVLDELPTASVVDATGGIDANRFPNLARLAGDGTWYPNATSVAAYTHEALPAIATGRYVSGTDVPPTASAHPESLFTLLAGTYEMRSLEQTTQLCPPELCETPAGSDSGLGLFMADLAAVYAHVALPEGARPGIPTVDEAWSRYWEGPRIDPLDAAELARQRAELKEYRDEVVQSMASEDRVGEFLSAVSRIEPSDSPTLDFLHVALPHIPWVFHADGSLYGDLEQVGLDDHEWTDQFAADSALQRHLLQTQFVDRLVGDLLTRLDEIGTYDETTIVVVGDHGVSFEVGEHRRLATEETFTSMMATPLLIKPQGSEPIGGEQTVVAPVETIDVLPTLARLIGLELPWGVDGVDLTEELATSRTRQISNRGSNYTTDESPLLARDALRSTIGELFGTGPAFEPYALAGAADLLGTSVGGTTVDETLCWKVTGQPEPGDGTTGWVTGVIEGRQPLDTFRVAVLIDGVVTATTRTHGTENRVTAVTDPQFGAPGAEIGIALLDEDPAEHPMAVPACASS